MRNLNNKSGFTLIEIIVVMIIIGVLAAIALPNMFSNIAKGKFTSILATLNTDKTPMELCLAQNPATVPGTAPCSLAAVGISAAPTIEWAVAIAAAPAPAAGVPEPLGSSVPQVGPTYGLRAVANGVATDFVQITRATDGTIACASGGQYAGMCPA